MSMLQKVKGGMGSPDWNGRHPPSKTPVGVLPETYQGKGK